MNSSSSTTPLPSISADKFALARLYSGSIKALFRLYSGSIQALFRLYSGSIVYDTVTVHICGLARSIQALLGSIRLC